MRNNLLIYSVISAIVFFILKIILNSFDLDFMYSIYQFSFFIIYSMTIMGIVQISKKNKILLVIESVIIVIISFIIIIGGIISAKKIKVVTIDNQKIVTETYGIPDPMTYYYKYVNSFLKSYNTIKSPNKSFNSTNNSTNIIEDDIILRHYNKQNSNNFEKSYN